MKKRVMKKLYKKQIQNLNQKELMKILKDCGIENVKNVGKNKGGVILNDGK